MSCCQERVPRVRVLGTCVTCGGSCESKHQASREALSQVCTGCFNRFLQRIRTDPAALVRAMKAASDA